MILDLGEPIWGTPRDAYHQALIECTLELAEELHETRDALELVEHERNVAISRLDSELVRRR